MAPQYPNIIALDVGDVRIGVAVAGKIARIPSALAIIPNDDRVMAEIGSIAATQQADTVVVGLPRDMNGLETAQSASVRKFAAHLESANGLVVSFADESLSSVRAEAGNLPYQTTGNGKHLDDVAACLILEEFLQSEGAK